jgi:hypothetical protein
MRAKWLDVVAARTCTVLTAHRAALLTFTMNRAERLERTSVTFEQHRCGIGVIK